MKALIFNSGLGSRLGRLTHRNPKAMVRLADGETIFGRQLRILHACGIDEFVVTTGPHPDQLMAEAAPLVRSGCSFTFVPNPAYSQTNYIYSMWRARNHLRGDEFLVLHGDLVFDAAYAQSVIDSPLPSLGSVNPSLPQPEKDFKARVVGGEVREVSVKIFDDDCVAFQPFYKLSGEAMGVWLDKVGELVAAGDVKVYAENAANLVFDRMHVAANSYEGHLVEEIDTPEDLERVAQAIRPLDLAQQPVWSRSGDGALSQESGCPVGAERDAGGLPALLAALGASHPLVVGSEADSAPVAAELSAAGVACTAFGGFSGTPSYEEVMVGVRTFQVYGCDSLVSVGGAGATGAAKLVKLFSAMPAGADERYADGGYGYSPYPHVAVVPAAGAEPARTTAALCVTEGREVEVAHDCLLPSAVVLS